LIIELKRGIFSRSVPTAEYSTRNWISGGVGSIEIIFLPPFPSSQLHSIPDMSAGPAKFDPLNGGAPISSSSISLYVKQGSREGGKEERKERSILTHPAEKAGRDAGNHC